MNKKYAVAVPALAVAAVTLSGCGGGGGGSAPAATHSVGSTLKTLVPGDAWTYNVDGWEYRTGSPNIYVTSGSYTLGTQTDARNGQMSLTHALTVKWNDNSSLTQNFLEDIVQSGGQISRRNDTLDNPQFGNAGNIELADPVVPHFEMDGLGNYILDPLTGKKIFTYLTYGTEPEIPGSWSATTGLSADNSFETLSASTDGTGAPALTVSNHVHFGVTVIGKETVTVPAGTFETWKTNMVTGYQTQGISINATAWWAPELGSYVKMDTTETVSTGQQVLHYQLKSTTVAH